MATQESRQRILDELRRRRGGMDVEELAGSLGLHANTVRWHLGRLADEGVVQSRPAARAAPGRPRILYSLAPAAAAGRDEHRLLAAMLTGALAQEPNGAERAAEVGRSWGRHLVPRPVPYAKVDGEAAVEQVGALLAEAGFAPEPEGREIRMRRCPFHDLAEAHPDVVCAVHRGLIDGALGGLGSELGVDRLDVFVEPDLCVAHLRRRAG